MMLAVLQVGMRLWQATGLEWRGRAREKFFSHQYFPSLFSGGIKPSQSMYGALSYLRKNKKIKICTFTCTFLSYIFTGYDMRVLKHLRKRT